MLNNWPYYETDEINLVSQILLNGKVSTPNGTYGEKFEPVCHFSNRKYALRLSMGLQHSLLHINLLI